MLTGVYPHVHGLTENDGRFGGRDGLDPADWMLQRSLLDAGYRCAWFGKWHVDNTRSALDYGFEGFSLAGYGYPYASEAYREYLDRARLAEPLVTLEIPGESGRPAGEEIALCERPGWFDYESGTALLDGPAATHEAFFLADLAGRWIDAAGDDPWFLRVDTWGPHPPYLVGEPFIDALAADGIELPANFDYDLAARPQHHRDYRDYWRQTLGLDRDAWRLMFRRGLEQAMLVETALCALLDRIDLGQTLVIFTSDHGDAIGSNGAVANKGGLLAEATLRIPLLCAGPGVPTGEVRDGLVGNLDLVPTVLDAAGIETRRQLHGRSLLPLASDSRVDWRSGLMSEHYGLHDPIAQRAWHEDHWKLVLQPDGYTELYDLSMDPGEEINRAREPRLRQRLDSMVEQLAKRMAAVDDHWSADAADST